MCVWRRPHRLERTIGSLAGQTHRAIRLCIWNNSSSGRATVDSTVTAFRDLEIDVVHSARNVGGFGRFYLARELAADHGSVVFLDDDQVPSSEFVETLVGEFRPGMVRSSWGYRFRGTDRYADRIPAGPGERVKYCGTGGMICDTRAFAESGLFACPRRFWFVEDLWLSYYADHVLRWPLYKSGAEVIVEPDRHDQYQLLLPTKDRLFRHLVRRGWNPVLPESGENAT